MKIIPEISSFSGTPYPDVYGEFDVTRIHGYENLFLIRVKNSWPQVEIFVEGARDLRREREVWDLLTELKVVSRFARAIIKQVKEESFEAGQNDIKNKFKDLIG